MTTPQRVPASPREPVNVTPVRAEHVAALAPMLARAFDVDAAYQYLIPDAAKRLAGLTEFFSGNLRVHLPYACTHVSLDDRGPCATVTLRPPGGVHVSTLTMVRHGLLPFAFAHGRSAVKRLLWLKKTYDALEAEAARGQPHWYVHMMAVRPDQQGRGLGSRLLERMLAETADRVPRLQCVLTTHLRQNLAFYQRAGFEVTDERTLEPPDGSRYTVWSMVRPARATI
jgi:ribosomal protein S18 acetylase RimI-like enzyme